MGGAGRGACRTAPVDSRDTGIRERGGRGPGQPGSGQRPCSRGGGWPRPGAHPVVPLMEAFMYRFHPQNVRVRALVAQGAIGDVEQVRAGFCFRMDPLDPANVRLQPALAGGALLDVGCYAVNASRMVFGEEPQRARAWRAVDERFGVDVALAGVLEYPGRRLATVDCSFKATYSGWYTVLGRDGVIEVPRAFTPQRDEGAVVIISDAQGNRRG